MALTASVVTFQQAAWSKLAPFAYGVCNYLDGSKGGRAAHASRRSPGKPKSTSVGSPSRPITMSRRWCGWRFE